MLGYALGFLAVGIAVLLGCLKRVNRKLPPEPRRHLKKKGC